MDNRSPLHKTLEELIDRSAKAQVKFLPGTSQHTLLSNRIHALRIANALLSQEFSVKYLFSKEDLESAYEPLVSLIRKSEKSIINVQEGTWQHSLLERNIEALKAVLPLLETALSEYRH